MPPTLGLACAGFSDSDRDSLCATLARLEPYLRARWQLVDDSQCAALCLVNLDAGVDAACHHARRVGCAERPREFAAGTLHRPLRVPQLLALLTETGRALAEDGREARGVDCGPAPSAVQLLVWPLDLEGASRTCLHVLSALTFAPADPVTLAARTGEDVAAVERELERLMHGGLVVRAAGGGLAMPESAAPPASWRGLVKGWGRRLGLAL